MSALAPTLPPTEPEDLASMTPKERFLRLMAGNLELAYTEYVKKVESEGDIEDRRKMVSQAIEALNYKVEVKKDPNDHLPVFNIIVNGGGVSVQQISAPDHPPGAALTFDLPTVPLDTPWAGSGATINDELGDLDA